MSKKSHKKEEAELIEDGLKAIYEGDKKVDFTKLERRRGRLTTILLTTVVSLGLLAGLSWGAFFIYNKYFAASQTETFHVEIEVPDEMVSGERGEIVVRYDNPNTVPITALELDMRIPNEFIVEDYSPSPANEQDLIWSIGTLSPGSDGVIVISGIWIAETPSSTPIQVLANYRPANFNSDFQDIETVYVDTIDSTLELSVSGSEETTPGEVVKYEIEVNNTGDVTLENTRLDLGLPDGFFLEESDPEIEAGLAPTWNLEPLVPGEPQNIRFEGTFAADAEGFQYFDAVLGIEADSRLLTQAKERGFTDLLGSDLTLQLIVNGGTDDIGTGLGENLRATLSYENSGEAELEDVEILLDFQSEDALPIIWSEAELDGGRITSNGVLWDAEEIGTLAAGERHLLNMIFPVASTVGDGQADFFTLVASISEGPIEVKSSPVVVTISSEAGLRASARYYTDDGAPLGSGPIPPQVGETTSYRIYWIIDNSLHDIEDVEVSATLPPQVNWAEESAAELGSITYDSTSKTVTWKISNVPQTVTKVQSNFTVSVTPEEDDVGKFVKLTSGSILKAVDTVTNESLESSADSLTTELIGDEFADGKGVVVE